MKVGKNQLMAVSKTKFQFVPFSSWKMPGMFSTHSQMQMIVVQVTANARPTNTPSRTDFHSALNTALTDIDTPLSPK